MYSLRSRARAWGRVAGFLLLCSLAFTAAPPAGAETKNGLPVVTQLGMAPFQGTPQTGCLRLVEHGLNSLTMAECTVGTAKQQAGQCTMDYIQDGVKAMTFSYWRHPLTPEGKEDVTKPAVRHDEAKLVMLRMLYPKGHDQAGDSVAKHDPLRHSYRCETGNADGAELWLPLTCRNWTTEPPILKPVVGPVPVLTTPNCLYSGTVTSLDQPIPLNSLSITGCGCCTAVNLQSVPAGQESGQQIILNPYFCN